MQCVCFRSRNCINITKYTAPSYVAQLGQFRMETRTALKKTELVFKLNEDFVEITGDGRRATSRITLGLGACH